MKLCAAHLAKKPLENSISSVWFQLKQSTRSLGKEAHEVINGDYVTRKYLKPGEKPEAEFYVSLQKGMIVRESCNIHGLGNTSWNKTISH